EVFGKKGDTLSYNNRRIDEVRNSLDIKVNSHYDISDYVKLLSGLVSKYVKEYPVSEVYVVSGEFKNVLVQRAKCQKIFPAPEKDITKTQYTKVEGDRLDFINAVFGMYLQKLFTGIVTEHLVAELSARVMAMDNSVRNAKNMFEKLSGLYNKVRQAKITQELTEIVSSIECVQ
ncbi:MAG: F0F1 ATP synthase subunit gamma, partial [Alphaproteobacteria bacterium]|nr:F0F1 ATP synthase subunit gamma [Alphaproteobacteria bacterium]